MTLWRHATAKDIPAVMALLADDKLGATRESADPAAYIAAFKAMQDEGANHLIVGTRDDQVVACYQITFISGLSLTATRRAQIEGVRVCHSLRGQGVGAALMQDAEARAHAAGCRLVQLTSNATRADVHRFYTGQGYQPSHIGFKKPL